MSRTATAAFALAALLATAIAIRFAFESAALRQIAPAASALASGVGVAAGLGIAASWRVAGGSYRRMQLAFFALGALAGVGAPLAVATHRYSDAPPGSEVLFLTTACWAAMLAVLVGARGQRLKTIAGAVLGLAGAAGIVANWERPSSFSVFVRYRSEELWMLAAGVAWAALWAYAERAAAARKDPGGLASAAVGAAAGALALALSRWEMADIGDALLSPAFWAIAASSAVVWASSVVAFRRGSSRLLAAAWFLPAAALTALTAIEQALKPFGIQPILLGQAAAGAVVAAAGAVLVAGAASARTSPGSSAPPIARAAALAASACALVALVTPALVARVFATRVDGSAFQASFTLLGAETVGGWAVLGLSLVGLAAAFSRRSGSRGTLLATAALASAALPLVWSTPLHTLSSAIPSEIQVDYGSEFASIRFEALRVPVLWFAVAGALAATAVVWWRSRPEAAGEDPGRGDAS
ncbi:MAG: hypothetical protein N3B11_04945 [Coriobacteriia bacterium]|nr:hypothetical protein [Coriobacteriia bacterium]